MFGVLIASENSLLNLTPSQWQTLLVKIYAACNYCQSPCFWKLLQLPFNKNFHLLFHFIVCKDYLQSQAKLRKESRLLIKSPVPLQLPELVL